MQKIAIALAFLALLGLAAAGTSDLSIVRRDGKSLRPVNNSVGDSSWCPTCVSFMNQAVQQIINIVIRTHALCFFLRIRRAVYGPTTSFWAIRYFLLL